MSWARRSSADFPGNITAVRLFTNSAEGGSHTVRIWNCVSGALIGGPFTWTITSGTAGWKTLTLPAPVHVNANTNYVVAISNGPDRNYAEQLHGLDATITNGNLHAVAGGGVWTDCAWDDADTGMAKHQLLPRRGLCR